MPLVVSSPGLDMPSCVRPPDQSISCSSPVPAAYNHIPSAFCQPACRDSSAEKPKLRIPGSSMRS